MAVLFHGRVHAFGTPAELARDLWSETEVTVDLGGTARTSLLGDLSALDGVVAVVPTADGFVARVHDADVTPALVRACVAAGVDVRAVSPHTPTLEDVYFAVEARAQATGHDDGLGARPVAS